MKGIDITEGIFGLQWLTNCATQLHITFQFKDGQIIQKSMHTDWQEDLKSSTFQYTLTYPNKATL
jgi:hypothetical protein